MNIRISRYFYARTWRWGFWFRLSGRGLSLEVDRPMLFSERHGHRKVRRIGRFSVEVLSK
ncbi:hypothetical protein [Paraburkholderia phenazinium]|uniref:hypothetical protein n=1 Tax=Paraburkholderia phenazinium TaxID=60549 RepID=UPI000940C38F|nr:hypothetical protein [Paraburkholderia phenazinium]